MISLRYVAGQSVPRHPLGTATFGIGVTAWVGVVTAATDAAAADSRRRRRRVRYATPDAEADTDRRVLHRHAPAPAADGFCTKPGQRRVW